MILALYTSSDYNLSMCRVLFPSILSDICFGRNEYCKRRKGSHSVNTGDMVIVLAFCHFPHGPRLVYQVLFNSLLYFQGYAPDKLNIAKIRKGSHSVNSGDMVIVLAFCHFPHGPLVVNQVSFHSLVYFQRYSPDKLFIAKIKKGSKSVNTVDRVMHLSSCTFFDNPLSIYQVSINSHVNFERYAPDKLFMAKIEKGSNSVNTVDMIMNLA